MPKKQKEYPVFDFPKIEPKYKLGQRLYMIERYAYHRHDNKPDAWSERCYCYFTPFISNNKINICPTCKNRFLRFAIIPILISKMHIDRYYKVNTKKDITVITYSYRTPSKSFEKNIKFLTDSYLEPKYIYNPLFNYSSKIVTELTLEQLCFTTLEEAETYLKELNNLSELISPIYE